MGEKWEQYQPKTTQALREQTAAQTPEAWRERALSVEQERDDARADAEALREALRTICDIGETRDVEVARAALSASEGSKDG